MWKNARDLCRVLGSGTEDESERKIGCMGRISRQGVSAVEKIGKVRLGGIQGHFSSMIQLRVIARYRV